MSKRDRNRAGSGPVTRQYVSTRTLSPDFHGLRQLIARRFDGVIKVTMGVEPLTPRWPLQAATSPAARARGFLSVTQRRARIDV